MARLLQAFDLTVLVSDPYATKADAEDLGTTPVPLPDLLRRSDIVTLHAPSLPGTRGLLDADRLALLPDHATVINTAGGSLIDTDALTAECVSGRLSAILDVTDPEPLPIGSPLFGLPNVQLTPHIPARVSP
ncbi:NAD(P)-dependent oxidoreductase [Nonomuraea angiospora]|uniref:Phosphoglycerate dehydrogenase-like enzyme n=1 Tax=Nonomuraea angiospora TaxID=46172 RepID=A0ABR9LPV8_9ACTN|nr:NAD(P)-dependent oxidoreductase [Nonomuraea angiospora]MBE1582678.1 phosphoglycerate dehydrogenase-like enzyme [Nonomuraea angiospora]